MAPRRPYAYFALVWVVALLNGCAGTLQADRLSTNQFPRSVELIEVPFFPQEDYQCGPAALATLINWSGTPTTPEALVPQVYVPAREGSLQVEMVAAARRQGLLPYVLKPELAALMTEIAAGNPVMVLQNLGLSWHPTWHYAVVVGFDLPQREIILRSGTRKRYVAPLSLFERTWARSQYWALVVMPPDKLPATAEELSYLEAVLGLEQLQLWQPANRAYAAALSRWPDSLSAQIGLGNTRYASGDKDGAEAIFRQATLDHPDAAAAFNNLAQVLVEQGRLGEAAEAAQRAVTLGGPLLKTYENTLNQIQQRQRGSAGSPVAQ
ncbi:MAG TPA: PA2778 family cysteine peptidase [Acidiferrobacterales bacterium]|nr:PA2778 family cysteine peptidase [Acidiferrobacterales bacterium]